MPLAGLPVLVAFKDDVVTGIVTGCDPLPAPPPITEVDPPPSAPPLLTGTLVGLVVIGTERGSVEFPAPPPMTGVEAPPEAPPLLPTTVVFDVARTLVVPGISVPVRPSPGMFGVEVTLGGNVDTGVELPAPPPMTGVLAPPEAPPAELMGG